MIETFKSKDQIIADLSAEIETIGDGLGLGIDKGVKEAVIYLKALGFNTTQSCEGHRDEGLPYPWVEIEAPDKPEEHFVGESDSWKKQLDLMGVNSKNDLPTEFFQSSEYWDMIRQISEAPETKEYLNWNEQNEKILDRAKTLLEEFYKNRNTPDDIRIILDHGRLRSNDTVTRDYGGWDSQEEEREAKSRLEIRQQEMADFVEFLKQKFLNS